MAIVHEAQTTDKIKDYKIPFILSHANILPSNRSRGVQKGKRGFYLAHCSSTQPTPLLGAGGETVWRGNLSDTINK